jgi:hypothetical protein
MDGNYVVYLHLNPKNHEVFYVGVGNEKRPFQTVSRNNFWKNYVSKNGLPKIEIFMTGLNQKQAFEVEIELIDLFGRRGFIEKGQLVNISIGGAGIRGHIAWNKGKKMSDDMRARRSDYMLKNGKNHISAKGKKTLSIKMLGQNNPMRNKEVAERVSISQSKKVYQYSLDGILIRTFDGARRAAQFMNCDFRGIHRAIKGEYKTYKGYIWAHTNTHTNEKNRL